ncbi:T7SS effector LXG polymorphic toxin [Aciduricibacillus chroicocephali]|uniref:T7SS effector LXG polymorphic toxin n=1 Tax=Aciduricibacillus chroicocephali TaxID=3054939 RepID=A0ABY9KX93_9BACI|nr:T7SS effector LXG polymorphic toxin [Bacillaceae bacterium 44XB]
MEDSFKGKTAESIFSFYRLCHEMFLTYMLEFLSEYSKVLSEIKEAIHSYGPHVKGYINEKFIEQDVAKALDKLEDQTENLADEANNIMTSVSDIVALEQLKTWEFNTSVRHEKEKGKKTVEQLLDLDHYKAMRL